MKGKEYELKIKAYFEKKLLIEQGRKIQVDHLRTINNFELDLSYTINIGGFDYFTIIECKNWNKTISQGMLTALKGVMDEVKAQKAIMVTALGFQSGAIKYAKSHRIGLTVITKKMNETKFLNASGPLPKDITQMLQENKTAIAAFPYDFDIVGIITPAKGLHEYFVSKFGYDTMNALINIQGAEDLVNYLSGLDIKIKNSIIKIPVFWKKDYVLSETDGLNMQLSNQSNINVLGSLITVAKFYLEKFKL
ncbi:MAG: restriction endonuclease [Ferruginibacter sp.]|nr:restriction endonuclease [Bacteroidota bacterium]MBX2920199.1 restriction endonuclease [Ferruginibacter sp.]